MAALIVAMSRSSKTTASVLPLTVIRRGLEPEFLSVANRREVASSMIMLSGMVESLDLPCVNPSLTRSSERPLRTGDSIRAPVMED